VFDVHRSDADVGPLDARNAGERGEHRADAVLTGHSIDVNMREHI
jgi:hypothetical protein